MAFSLEEAPIKAERHIAPLSKVEDESKVEVLSETTTSSPIADDSKSPSTVIPENEIKFEEVEPSLSGPVLFSDNDEKAEEEGDRNPKIVFIERLMGLHLSAPLRKPDESDSSVPETEPNSGSSFNSFNNPIDKMNAKWASRLRKFSIPLQSSTDSQPPLPLAQHQNPMLRYAAAAMLSRLVAAAARAQMEAQSREALTNQINRNGKDKDDDTEEEVVPVIVATMRDERPQEPRSLAHMYGRPMPRESMSKSYATPFTTHQHQRQIPAMSSMPQRAFISLPPPQAAHIASREPLSNQRRSETNVQPVVMLALPLQSLESRQSPMSIQIAQSLEQALLNHNQRTQMPFYPTVPYPLPFVRSNYQSASSYAVPVHVPVPVPMNYPSQYYQRSVYQYPAHQAMPAYSHVRPVIEVPVEVPVPYHVPFQVPVSVKANQASDNDLASSERDHIVLLYDAEANHDENDDLETAPSESRLFHTPAGSPKGSLFLNRPLPSIMSPHKMKLWKEFVGAKHAAQPGVRFIPVAVPTQQDEPSQPQENNFGQSSVPQPLPLPPQQSPQQLPQQPQTQPQPQPQLQLQPQQQQPQQPSPPQEVPREERASESEPQPTFFVLAEQEEH